MSSPYILSYHVKGLDFYGRTELVSKLLTSRNKLLWLRGNRRTGKTSTLLNIFYSRDANAKNLIYYIDFGKTASYRDWSKLLQSAVFYDPMRENKTIQVEEDLKGKQNLDFFELQNFLSLKAKEHNLQLLLLCDEVEAWIDAVESTPEAKANLLKKLRFEWEKLDLRVILSATGRLSALKKYENGLTSPLFSELPIVFIAQLSVRDAYELIEQSHHGSNTVIVSDRTKIQIASLTGHHPFLIQFLCDKLYNDGKLRDIRLEDLTLTDYLNAYFSIDFDGLLPQEQLLLIQTATSNFRSGKTTVEQLKYQTSLSNIEFETSLDNLVQLGMINDRSNYLTVNNYFLFKWLIQNKTVFDFNNQQQISVYLRSKNEQQEALDKINSALSKLGQEMQELKSHIRKQNLERLDIILMEIHQGRMEQGQLSRIASSTQTAIKHILNSGVLIDDPKITSLLREIQTSIYSDLTLSEQIELTLPIIPFLLEYKVNLGAGVDLQALWKELVERIKKP